LGFISIILPKKSAKSLNTTNKSLLFIGLKIKLISFPTNNI